jgi:hypothetical protein
MSESLPSLLKTLYFEHAPVSMWYDEGTLRDLTLIRHVPGQWGELKAYAKRQGMNPYDLEKAVDAVIDDPDLRVAGVGDTLDPFMFTDAAAILAKPLVPRRWLLPGIIPDGLTLLGGSPKSGKSYLAYALALAVAQFGVWCHHWEVAKGKVIYAALEDEESDTHLRLAELLQGIGLSPGRLMFVHGEDALPAFNNGALAWVEQTLELHRPRLLIIDPISYLYVLKKSGSQFEETKDMLFPLRWLGKRYQCAIVCPDHRRKRSREDVSAFDTLYGSVAKQAVADSLIMVDRDDSEITLDVKIRAGKDQKVFLNFTFQEGQCYMEFKGGGEDKPASYSDFRMKVHTILREAHVPLSVPEILGNLELPDTKQTRNSLYQVLFRSQKSREIEKTTRGLYVWAEHE